MGRMPIGRKVHDPAPGDVGATHMIGVAGVRETPVFVIKPVIAGSATEFFQIPEHVRTKMREERALEVASRELPPVLHMPVIEYRNPSQIVASGTKQGQKQSKKTSESKANNSGRYSINVYFI